MKSEDIYLPIYISSIVVLLYESERMQNRKIYIYISSDFMIFHIFHLGGQYQITKTTYIK